MSHIADTSSYAATVRRAGSATPPPARRQAPSGSYRGQEGMREANHCCSPRQEVSQLDIAMRDVRAVAEAQSRLLHVVEGISEELARVAARVEAVQHFAGPADAGRQQTEVLSNVDRLNKVVHELQRVVQTQRADSTPSSGLAMQLVRHEAALAELQRCRAEDVARLEAAVAERRHSQQAGGGFGDGGLVARLARQEAEIGDLRRQQAEAQSAYQRQQQQAAQIAQHEAAIKALQQLPEEVHRLQEAAGREPASVAAKIGRLEEEIAEVSSRQQSAAADGEVASNALLGLRSQTTRLDAECGEVRRRLQDLAAAAAQGSEDAEAAARLGRCEAAASQAQSRSARLADDLRQQHQVCVELEEKLEACNVKLERGRDTVTTEAHEALAARVEAWESRLSEKQEKLAACNMKLERGDTVTTETHDALAARVEACESRLSEKQEALQKQLLSELRLELRGAVQGQQNALSKRLESWEARLQEELSQRLQRQVAELKMEVRGGVQSQEGKLRALEQQFSQLDEQVWQADKRIRARVEELSCGSFTAAVARASEALGSSVASGRLAEPHHQSIARGEVGAAKGAAASRMQSSSATTSSKRLPSSPAWGSVEDEEDEALSARPAPEREKADEEGAAAGAGAPSLRLGASGEEPPSLRGSFGRGAEAADEDEEKGEEYPGGGSLWQPPSGGDPPPSLQEVLWCAANSPAPSGSPLFASSTPPPPSTSIIGSADAVQSGDSIMHVGFSGGRASWRDPLKAPPSGLSGSFLTAATSAANAFAEATMDGLASKIGSAKMDVPVSSTSSTGSSTEWVEAAHQEQ